MNLMTAMFCNCCHSGCDCGCVVDCRLVDHRSVLIPTPAQEDHR